MLIAFALMGIVIFGLALIMPLVKFIPIQQKDNYGLFLMFSVGIIYLTRRHPIYIEDYGFGRSGIRRTVIWGGGGGLCLSALNFPLLSVTQGAEWIDFEKFLESNNDNVSIISFLVFASLIIPMMEEVFFRGCVYRILKNRYGECWSTLITSIAFAIGHADIIFAFYSYIFIRINENAKFLGASIIAHILWNSSWYLSIYLFNLSPVRW